MRVLFKDFIDYSKRIGKMIIAGDEGTGKTLLLTCIAVHKMLYFRSYIYKAYAEIDKRNSLGYNFSKNFEHLCFSNYDINCFGTEMPTQRSYIFSPYKCGLFNDNYETIPFPPYTLLCCTEGKNYLDSYLFKLFPNSYIMWLRTLRQAKIDMVVDCQCFSDIVTMFRRITNRFIYLYKECEQVYNVEGVRVGHKLFVYEFNRNVDAELYESTGKKQNCKEYELILDLDMFDCYDNEFCKYLHLKGRALQDYVLEHFPDIKTIDDVENFAESIGAVPPDNFFKNSKKVSEKCENIVENDNNFEENDYF